MAELSIVITYFNREKQVLKSLDSFLQYSYNFNVIIVDDNSPKKLNLKEYPFEIIVLRLKNKNWICPAPVFNFGFIEALKNKPKYIIIQNAECYHKGDILGYILKNCTDKNYLTFGCYSLGKGENIDKIDLNNVGAISNGDSAWYNHSRYRPEALHFCSALTSENLVRINGFDERFAMGLGYEDNYLIHQIRCLGLKIEIIDEPFVFHQYHYDQKAFEFNTIIYSRNAQICKELKKKNEYRAEHLISPDLCL